ncbi:hypothetical protein H8E88_02530 [candidate division KSB1 bacterium]|nr:hypothetical protein [candidate division KSB1 bacterium]
MKNAVSYYLICLIAVAFFGFAATTAYKTWFLGSNESDYEIICIGGHEYYRASFAYKGLLSIRLNNDGTPIRCNGEKEKMENIASKTDALTVDFPVPLPTFNFFNGTETVGKLSFAGPKMIFTGNADESAKIFFDFLKKYIDPYIEQGMKNRG